MVVENTVAYYTMATITSIYIIFAGKARAYQSEDPYVQEVALLEAPF